MKYNIWKECPLIPLTELLSFIVDNRGKTVPTAKTGHKLIATNCVTNKTLFPIYEKVRYLSDEIYNTWFRSHPIPGDILFVNKGTPGRVCMVPDPVDFCIAQDMIALRANNKKIYNTNVGDVIPHFKKQFLKNILIPVPEYKIQKIIGNFYYNLSYKIEINNKINEKLEQQAQSFYQELFVDKDDYEWKEGTISDLGTVVGGSTPSKTKSEYYTDKGIAWITPKDLSINKSKFIYHGENDITELGMNNSSATIMPEGTVLFSSRAPIGYIAVAAGEVTTNQGFKSVIPHPEIGTAFVYYFLKNNLSIIEGMASGSTFKEISGSTMKRVPAFIPDKSSLTRFNEFCHPIFEKQKFLEKENVTLASIRDALLPRLMSGELDVSELDI